MLLKILTKEMALAQRSKYDDQTVFKSETISLFSALSIVLEYHYSRYQTILYFESVKMQSSLPIVTKAEILHSTMIVFVDL